MWPLNKWFVTRAEFDKMALLAYQWEHDAKFWQKRVDDIVMKTKKPKPARKKPAVAASGKVKTKKKA